MNYFEPSRPKPPEGQLSFILPNPVTVDIDGRYDERSDGNVSYIGKATQQFDGTWRCLANVFGTLCLVEVNITFA